MANENADHCTGRGSQRAWTLTSIRLKIIHREMEGKLCRCTGTPASYRPYSIPLKELTKTKIIRLIIVDRKEKRVI